MPNKENNQHTIVADIGEDGVEFKTVSGISIFSVDRDDDSYTAAARALQAFGFKIVDEETMEEMEKI